jgi:hypothetical protein
LTSLQAGAWTPLPRTRSLTESKVRSSRLSPSSILPFHHLSSRQDHIHKRREGESDLRDIKLEYLVLVLLDLVNMLVKALQAVLSLERSGLVAFRFRASLNRGRGIFPWHG